MGDDGIDFRFDEFENVLQLQFNAPSDSEKVGAIEARRTLEEALRDIPDSALSGLRSFRIIIAS